MLSWRTQHSYMVTDRFDVVETQDEVDSNTVSFYGYVRGTYLDKYNRVHINGLGDYDISDIQKVEDPVPIEVKKTAKQKEIEHNESKLGVKKRKAMRTLKDKEKIIYAPFSNIGALNFEKTTGYITIPDKQVIYTRVGDDGEPEEAESGIAGAKVQRMNAQADLGQG